LRRVIALLALLLAPLLGGRLLASTPEAQFRSVAVPQNLVPSIAQDRAGYLWVATAQGLMRYDGYRLKPLQLDGQRAAERNLGWIRALAAGRDGSLWIGSETQGLLRHDPRSETVERLGSAAGPHAQIRALAEGSDGAVWVGSLGGGLSRYLPATRRHEPQQLLWRGQPENRVLALLATRDGSVWAGHWRGLARREGGHWVTLELPEAAAGVTVLSLAEDGEGRLWFGTQDGRLGLVERGMPRWLRHDLRLPVQALTLGAGGRLWVGTKKGLLVLDPGSGETLGNLQHDPRQPLGLAGDDISSLLRDRDGALWVAGYGVGLQRLQRHPAFALRGADADPGSPLAIADIRAVIGLHSRDELLVTTQTGAVVRLDARPGRALATLGVWPRGGRPGIVEALAEGPRGEIWLASGGRLQQHATDGRLLRDWALEGGRAQRLLLRGNGEVWLGMQEGLYRLAGPAAAQLQRLHPQGGRPLQGAVHALIEDGETVWVGGQQGLLRWQNGRLAAVSEAPGQGLGAPIVMGLLRDRDGALWVDTAVGGLHRLLGLDEQGRARFDRISERLGVEGRFGGNLELDAQGRIWSQLMVYDPQQDRIDSFGAAEGVSVGTFWFFASAATPDGRLLFGSNRGLLVVQPRLFTAPQQALLVVLSALRVDEQSRPVPEAELRLPPGTRSLGVEFAALDYADPAALRYQYRLLGLDSRWLDADAGSRSPRFGSLPPGRYTLQVRASRHPSLWSGDPLELAIELQPAWWQTAWARGAALLAGALALWGLLQWRTRSLRRRETQLQALVDARTAELLQASLTDSLTGLRNRRYLHLRLEEDLRLCLRRHAPGARPGPDSDLLLMLLDLDHFKRINDQYGHAAGDRVLVQLAERLRRVFRDTDSLVRWGGEELLALVRDTHRDKAAELAQRVVEAVRAQPYDLGDGRQVTVTASIGFVAFPLDPSLPQAWDWGACLGLADAALYAAKAQGRDGYVGAVRAQGLRPGELPKQPGAWLLEPRLELRRG
jgi:diguanylate cyclase (GGDEF)-like protein